MSINYLRTISTLNLYNFIETLQSGLIHCGINTYYNTTRLKIESDRGIQTSTCGLHACIGKYK